MVTAQCDLAHDKAPFVNFVPIVHLSDWLARDAEVLLARRICRQETEDLKSMLESLGLSTAVVTTEPARVVVDQFVLAAPAGALKAKQRERAARIPGTLADAEAVLSGGSVAVPMREQHPGAARRLLRELLEGNLAGYYFLPAVSPTGVQSGHVVLLRQVYHLTRALALDVPRGVLVKDLAAQLARSSMYGLDVDRDPEDIIEPVGQIASPFLEHVMQAFGTLFMRIGVTDLPGDFASMILSTHYPAPSE